MKNRRYNNILLRALTILCLMMASVGAWAQAYYVFQNGTYGYLYNDNGTLKSSTTFQGASSVWYSPNALGTTSQTIRSYSDNSRYLNVGANNGGTVSLGTNTTARWQLRTYLTTRSGTTNYYLKATNATSFSTATGNNGNRYTPYAVEISSTDPSLSEFTINGGTSEMTATGNSPAFSHSNATYTAQRTNYRFNNADHYVNGASATVSYTWTLSGIEDTYADVTSAGVVRYKSLIPERERTATLTCTATAGGLTQTATTTIKFVNPNALYSPSISYDNAAGGKVAVTLSYPESDPEVKLYYTTDGSTPSSSSTLYTGTFEVASNTTVKVIAVKGATTSGVTSEVVTTISSGVSGGKVVLDDREDHTWTYYLPNGGVDNDYEYPDRLCSPYPRNAKITYYGNGKVYTGNTTTTSIADNATGVADATGVQVSRYETENTFVYYKTLEREGTSGRFGYEVIPNPFSKRPTYGTDANAKWRGFYGWRIKSLTNGTIHSAATGGTQYNKGDIITTECQQLYFQPTDNGMTNANNATSMEVEFEAVWARAYRVTCAAGDITGTSGVASTTLQTGVSYERNFVVVTSGTSTTNMSVADQRPVTITMIEPDGSTDYRTADRYYNPAYLIARNSLKIEWMNLRVTNTIGGNGQNVVLGRGIMYNGASHTASNGTYGTVSTNVDNTNATNYCAVYINGLGYNTNTTAATISRNCDYKLRIESGVYRDVGILSTNSGSRSNMGNGYTVHAYAIVGNDYDRALQNGKTLNGTRMLIYDHLCEGVTNGIANDNHANAHRESMNLVMKSGYIGLRYDNQITNGTYKADLLETVYLGISSSIRTSGYRRFRFEGGNVAGITGGIDRWGETSSTSRANNYDEPMMRIRIVGQPDYPIVRGPAFAGAANTQTFGYRQIVMTGGIVKGWLAGGCNGTSTASGVNWGPSYIYVGGNGQVNSGGNNNNFNQSQGGHVFGAGSGTTQNMNTGRMEYGTHVVVADNAYVERNVYGGGNLGYTEDAAKLFLTGGRVGGMVFGGANQRQGGTVDIVMTGGTMEGGVYGGSNVTGNINSYVTMHIDGGQVGTESVPGYIHGGGYGNETRVLGSVNLTLGKDGAGRDADGVTVYGDVYGGSAQGKTNGNTARNGNAVTNVTMYAGYIHGSLYGGGLGTAGTNGYSADVYGPVKVTVNGGSVFNTDGTGANGSGAVYGANNVKGAPQMSATVDIYGTNSAPAEGKYALFSVYGGGNAADYTYGNGYPKVTVHNCDNSIEYVYGGGNAAAVAATDVTIYGGDKIGNVFGGGNGQVRAANVTGGTNVKIYGGTIGDVYGGSNTQGTIGGTINVNVNAQAEGGSTACPIDIDNVYGGGNKAASNVGNVTIGCAEHIGAVYGGANQANVTGNITLNIVSGHIDNVFGGNNNSGNISGSITVNVNDNGSPCGMAVGNVYGGGNLAKYGTGQNFPVVNIINGALTGSVFGGGKGETAVVTGNPQVNISDWNDAHEVTIGGNVFGGGDAAEVVGTPVVIIKDCDTQIDGNIYGGGNAAAVAGTNLTIWGGSADQVFGGGNGLVSPADVDGNASAKIYGGTFTEVYGGSNSQGDISGTISVEVNEHKSGDAGAVLCPVNIDDLYGGGNMADSRAGQISIGKCNHIGSVYGGANKANIEGDVTLNITDGHIDNVFGGNNNSGQVSGNITVNVNWANGVNAENAKVGNVYGGGNIASIDNGTPRTVTVNIPNATVSGSVFGGGKGKEAVIVGSTEVNIGTWSNTTSATINGDVFGGGDLAAVEGPCAITIRDCNTLITGDLYGGGNAAPVFSTNTTMWGGTVMGNVFGGGNGKDAGLNPNGAQVGYMRNDTSDGGTGVASTAILGGTVGTWVDGACTDGTGGVFGGSNTNGNIRGGIALTLDQQTCTEPGATRCPLILREIYGAGNEAAYAGTGIDFDLGCVDYLEEIYGGAKAADLNANASLHIRSGHFKRVFGGNNVSGKLNGTITVTIEEMGCNPIVIDELYGGGNLAPYSVYGYAADGTPLTSGDAKADPQINILSCTHIGTVFGGGLGASAVMVGNPRVNIQEVLGDFPKRHYNTATKTVSDGTNGEADELGSIGTVFGGGNEAKVDGDTHILVGTEAGKGAYILGNVYGGGNQADVTGKTNVTVGR